MIRGLVCPAVALAILATPALAQVKLELKHPENSSATYQTTSKLHQILNLADTDLETKSEEVITATEAIGAKRGDGSVPITSKIDHLRVKVELPGNLNVAFDSANPEADKSDNPMLENLRQTFKAAGGTSYTTVLGKDGKVAAVEGTEKAVEAAKDLDPMVRAEVERRLAPDRLKPVVQQKYNTFPDILVRKGDTWERTEAVPIGGGQTLTFKKTYEYQGPAEHDGKTLDKIGVKSTAVTYTMDPDLPSPIKVNKSDLKIEESDGTILFDREAGRIVKAEGKTRIKGEMEMVINDMELPAKLDLTIESSTVLQPSSK